jgi:hypothetical protein
MLTILSDTQVRTLSDSIKTIQGILESSLTVNFDGPTTASKLQHQSSNRSLKVRLVGLAARST